MLYNSSLEQEIHSGDISMQVSQEAHALWSSIRHLNKKFIQGTRQSSPLKELMYYALEFVN
jgi:hypothetical protein